MDLSEKQRAVMAQLQQLEGRLTALTRERESTVALINAARGKLDLIAELQAAATASADEQEQPPAASLPG